MADLFEVSLQKARNRADALYTEITGKRPGEMKRIQGSSGGQYTMYNDVLYGPTKNLCAFNANYPASDISLTKFLMLSAAEDDYLNLPREPSYIDHMGYIEHMGPGRRFGEEYTADYIEGCETDGIYYEEYVAFDHERFREIYDRLHKKYVNKEVRHTFLTSLPAEVHWTTQTTEVTNEP